MRFIRTAGTFKVLGAIVAATVLAGPASAAAHGTQAFASAPAPAPPVSKNCTALNKKYPHGIGRAGARDKTSGDPVTTFKRSNKLYRTAMSHNGRLDGDKDGIACEKE